MPPVSATVSNALDWMHKRRSRGGGGGCGLALRKMGGDTNFEVHRKFQLVICICAYDIVI